MYEVRHAGSKGLGVFALNLIPRGTRILSEQPLLSLTHDEDSSALYPSARQLPAHARCTLLGLSWHSTRELEVSRWGEAAWYSAKHVFRARARRNVERQPRGRASIAEHARVLSIFRSNAFALGGKGKGMGMGMGIRQAVFAGASRINHSCVPNAQGNFHEGLGRFNVHATRDIRRGEELSLNYLPEDGSLRDVRVGRLREGYGFECGCPACDVASARGREGEQKRVRIQALVKEFAVRAMEGQADGEGELWTIMEFIAMLESEGIAGKEVAEL
ncbi:TPR domain-containing protein [Diplocarpon rosae]|nr:TPR domain-containing protein [Diplocarpon rosae]